jgi:hypothetical protein
MELHNKLAEALICLDSGTWELQRSLEICTSVESIIILKNIVLLADVKRQIRQLQTARDADNNKQEGQE